MSSSQKQFVAQLRGIRERLKFTHREMSQWLGISRARYTEIEQAKHGATLELVDRIAEQMGVHPLDLISKRDPKRIRLGNHPKRKKRA